MLISYHALILSMTFGLEFTNHIFLRGNQQQTHHKEDNHFLRTKGTSNHLHISHNEILYPHCKYRDDDMELEDL